MGGNKLLLLLLGILYIFIIFMQPTTIMLIFYGFNVEEVA